MAWIAGVDGCPDGWLVVFEETELGDVDCQIKASFEDVMACHAPLAAVAVDMPIGLQNRGGRPCDSAARKALTPLRHSSIFPAPATGVVDLYREMKPAEREDRRAAYDRANKRSKELTDKGLTQQTWNLVPKIAEVDDCRRDRDGAPDILHEAHPEVSFAAMNAGDRGFAPMRHYKASMQGLLERRNILAREFGEALAKLETKAPDCKGDAAPDDFYDALACLWTARRIEKEPDGPARALCRVDEARKLDIRKLSESAPKGADDLPMRIVY